jgi:hypothetical protein
MQAVVITFDRLATRLLGCYGNEWIETPNLDRLATSATLFDNYFTDSVGPHSGSSWLTGIHAMRPRLEKPTAPIGDLLGKAGVRSRLLVANGSSSIPWETAGFDAIDRVAGQIGLEATPGDVSIARLVKSGISILQNPSAVPRLLWLHCNELSLPPEGFASLYFEDFEEREINIAEMPRDEWSRQIAVAAGGVSLIDHWLGEMLTHIQSNSADQPTLVIIAAARGRSWMDEFLADTPSVRKNCPADLLRDHETRSPLFVSVIGDERSADLTGIRCSRLVQSIDLAPTLADWFGVKTEPEEWEGRSLLKDAVSLEPSREAVYVGDDRENFGIRMVDWSCLMRSSSSAVPSGAIQFGDSNWPEQVQLFSKPEDIWDVTDLSTQRPADCEQFVQNMNRYRSSRNSSRDEN